MANAATDVYPLVMAGDWRDTGEAVLNAVFGDHLEQRGSELAIPMAFYAEGRPTTVPPAARRVAVLLHGMAYTEKSWAFSVDDALDMQESQDYGRLLEQARGFTPLYIRYNTGRPIQDNGRALSALLADAVTAAPIEEIVLIGHSLGGLVVRSACYEGQGQRWLSLVRRAFYLGSPHAGSPWERLGRTTTRILKTVPDPVTRLVGDVVDIRSTAIKDLGDGRLTEDGAKIPLDPNIEHFFVAGALSSPRLAGLIGDGLVPSASAIENALSEDHIGRFPGLNHMALARHPAVGAWILERAGPPIDLDEVPALPRSVVDAQAPERRRFGATLALVAEGVTEGASAVQKVQEVLTSRPYDLIEAIPPLAAPARAVRAVHFGLTRGVFGAVRAVSTMVEAAATPGGAPSRSWTPGGASSQGSDPKTLELSLGEPTPFGPEPNPPL